MNAERTSLRRLGRDTLIYSIGTVLSRAVSFFMLPVYTRYLTTSDYGVLQLLDMTVDIANILFLAGMTAGMSLFYFQTTDERARGTIVRTGFALEIALAAIAAISVTIAAPAIWRYGMDGAGSTTLVRMAGANFALQTISAAPLALLMMRQRSQQVVYISLAKLVLQLGLNILFVVGFKLGVTGILLTGMIVNAVLGAGLAVWMLRETEGGVSWQIVRRLRRFGTPYQITAAGAFILSFGDRFFLQASHGASAVGLYGLAYQFGFLLYQLGSDPLFKAWGPQRLQLVNAPAEVRDPKNARGFFYFNLLLITVATGIGVFIRPVLQVMTTPPFHSAAALVPIILVAYVVGSWMDAVKYGIDVSEKTKYVSYANWIAVVLIMGLYAWLIPPLGGLGAALATLVAFVVRFGLIYYWSQRLFPVRYDWRPVLTLAGIGGAAVFVATFTPTASLVTLLGISTFLMLAYGAVVWSLVLGPEDRKIVREVALRPHRALGGPR